MARPLAKNALEQENVREVYSWMTPILRERSRNEHTPNPLDQISAAGRIGIDQGCLSKWVNGVTKTLQKPGAWEKLLDIMCEARKYLPKQGWVKRPFLYYHDRRLWTLDFKGESRWARVASKNMTVECYHWCSHCHGLTPDRGHFCMHCGAVVHPQPLDEGVDEFLLDGDQWGIDVNDHTRTPVGYGDTKPVPSEGQVAT